ncbi:methyltransferase domain-containing protein [Pseudoroseomonas wenyumeiae]
MLATDLDPADPRAARWIGTGQHAPPPALPFRAVDMTRIPRDLHGQFDLVWSACALEHLGSLRAGENFILEAMRCLKPGGIAIHTTEFDLDADGPPSRAAAPCCSRHGISKSWAAGWPAPGTACGRWISIPAPGCWTSSSTSRLMARRPTAGRCPSRRKRRICGRWWKTASPPRSD